MVQKYFRKAPKDNLVSDLLGVTWYDNCFKSCQGVKAHVNFVFGRSPFGNLSTQAREPSFTINNWKRFPRLKAAQLTPLSSRQGPWAPTPNWFYWRKEIEDVLQRILSSEYFQGVFQLLNFRTVTNFILTRTSAFEKMYFFNFYFPIFGKCSPILVFPEEADGWRPTRTLLVGYKFSLRVGLSKLSKWQTGSS